MTFLTLCQDAARDCDLAGGSAVPTDVTTQTGELQRIVKFVENQWVQLQARHQDWRFMRSPFTFDTTISDGEYEYTDIKDGISATTISRFSRWRVNDPDNPATCFLTATGVGVEYRLIYLNWNAFKNSYLIGTQVDSQPVYITVDPRDNLHLGPVPSAVYTIEGTYQKSPQIMTADGDVPDFSGQDHHEQIIKWLAMKQYALSESDDSILFWAEMEYNRMVRTLETEQLPVMEIAEPMV